jgi:hypothetical protein
MSGVVEAFQWLPELLGLEGAAATGVATLAAAGAASEASKMMKPSTPNIPEPPKMPETPPSEIRMMEDETTRDLRRRARASTRTVYTSPIGILGSAPTSKKRLLGG